MQREPHAVVVITGAGSGLGAEVSNVLSRDGMTVIATDVRADSAAATVNAIRDAGFRAFDRHLDVTDERSVTDALQAVEGEHGRIDAVINCAGIDHTVPIEELDTTKWDAVMAVNLRGPFLMSRCAFAIMRRQGAGAIVNIVSTAALRAWPNASAYHASKWGLLGFSHALHTEGRPLGIKVTAVIAGGMRTPFILDRFPDVDAGTLQDPANVAETVRFVLHQPLETVIPEVMVLPMRETSWP